jgi:hypothetical protein
LRGALQNVGFDIGRSTIQRILKEHGIEPAPVRGKTMPWKTFLMAHWGRHRRRGLFQRGGAHGSGLVRYLVLFVIDLKTRRVHVAGICCQLNGAWMAQIGRNLTDAEAPFEGLSLPDRRS